MSKTNTGLVEYAKAQLGRPYWYGTFGNIASEDLWRSKKGQYGRYYSDKRHEAMKARGDIGRKVHDCLGLWKGYMMSADADAAAVYDKKYDYSADSIYKAATEKGSIDTMPDIAGIGLHKSGHFGVYIGGGREIEARGFDYGVLEDDVKSAGFTEWFKIPHIDYETQEAPVEAPEAPVEAPEAPKKSADEIADEVIRGDWGNGSERVQRLTEAGYDAKAIQDLVNEKLGVGSKSGTFEGVVATQKDSLRVRSGTGTQYGVVKYLDKGSKHTFDGESNGWYHLADGSGYVSGNYIKRL